MSKKAIEQDEPFATIERLMAGTKYGAVEIKKMFDMGVTADDVIRLLKKAKRNGRR